MLNISKLKKINSKSSINFSGNFNKNIKHRPVFTKEWFNSVYCYNDSNSKNLPSIDMTVAKLINNYFNMFYSRLEKSVLIKTKALLTRKLSLNKLLLAKPEFKHTSDRVIITLYVYNREISWIKKKMVTLRRLFMGEYYYRVLAKNIFILRKVIVLKTLKKKLNNIKLKRKNLINKILSFKEKLLLNNTNIVQELSVLRIKLPKWLFDNSKSLLNSKLRILKRDFYNFKELSLINKLRISFKFSFFRQIKISQFLEKRFKSRYIKNYDEIKLLITEWAKFKIDYRYYLNYLGKGRLNKRMMRKVKNLNSINKSLKISNNIIKETYIVIEDMFRDIFDQSYKSIDLRKYHVLKPKFNENNYLYYLQLLKVLYNMRIYMRYQRFIAFNKYKFNVFIIPLRSFLERIYKKKVEFNIITLKSYQYNSSIFAKVIVNKVKNRKIRLSKVFRSVFSKVKTPLKRKLDYYKEIFRNDHLQNIILRNYLNNKFLLKKPYFINSEYMKLNVNEKTNAIMNKLYMLVYNNDKLNIILKSIYKPQNVILKNNKFIYIKARKIRNVALDSIKNKSIGGIKLQVRGRLTKRVSAARSLLKIKRKGLIKDINSSYNKIPTVLLRGNLKSHIEYTYLGGKTRIGSFGLKGWISTM